VRPLAGAALGALLALAVPARAGVALADAWMRPAYAGQPEAAVYVDIRSTEPVALVGATMRVARRAVLVLVPAPNAAASTHRVVERLPVAANAPLRLALGGSHVRLIEVTHDVRPGERHALELAFVDAAGRRTTASVDVLVRGLAVRRPPAEDAAQAPPK
jgi:copper(I)-binding protein